MIGKAIFTAFFFTALAHAGLETEIAQQQETEKQLRMELEAQKDLAEHAYKEVVEFASTSPTNHEEQVKRLEEAFKVWDDFIEKTCRAEALESIGTRAEQANKLDCMIKRYKEKEAYFNSTI
ncbi:hypothetical protein MCB86_02505 [Pseudomonas sp. KSR10]|jgi:hypothetical protein|uniref:Lysozyme inhibitor LprI N-terminal domain-containing protein n=1 Tax=Stutzerimonas stutzeri TaxID=316 RepID=A0A0D9AVV5_STUST|nr:MULTISPECIES: hypothetical protein [Pseudomonadaceae]KJH85143.1 hypothetical protein UF78_00415 [Stutzerimonas stutzeri]MCG6538943.1 hypothetical protein [Pseudomonas sp. KSR10]